MNHYLLTCLAFFTTGMQAFSQNSIAWGPEITVADGATFGGIRPRMVLAADQQPVIIFGKGSAGDLYVAKGNGTGFNTPVAVLPQNMGTYLANWTGPDMAAQGNTIVAVFKALPFETGKVYAVRSTDGGATFSDTIRVDSHTGGRAWMPSVEMDPNGNPVVSYMVFDGVSADPRYVVARSTDGGLTYQPQVELTEGVNGEACDCCPSDLVIDGNREVLLFRNNQNNTRDVYAVLSEDQGATVADESNINHLAWYITSCPSTGPHGMLQGDSLFSVAGNRTSGAYRVYVSAATVENGTIEHEGNVMLPPPNSANGTQNYPRLSGANDTIVLAWEEKDPSNANIFYAVTVDGSSHSLAAYKAMANVTTTGVQTNPDIIYRDGFVHLAYQDVPSGAVIYRKGVIQEAVGVNEQALQTLSVAPNPSTDGVLLLSGIHSPQAIQLTDLSGKAIAFTTTETAAGMQIHIDAAAFTGDYLLRVQAANGQVGTVKLVLQQQ